MSSSDQPGNSTSTYDSNKAASGEQRAALLAVTDALRQLNEHCIFLNTDAKSLQQIAEKIGAITDEVKMLGNSRMLEYFRRDFSEDISEGLLPYSPVGGWHNAITPAIEYSVDGDAILAETVYGSAHEGPPDCVHGGIVAGVFDQVMAAVCALHKCAGPTAYMKVNYIDATPLRKKLRFSARMEKREGRKNYVAAECHCDNALVSSAEGLFIEYSGKQSGKQAGK